MKKNPIRIVMALALVLLAGTAVVFGGKSAKGNPTDLRAKARYYYVEGSVALAEGRTPEAYELFKKAAKTDPGYAEANYTYALMRMTLRNDTLNTPLESGKSIAMMKAYVDKYPEETEEAMTYAFLVARGGDIDEAIRVAERSDSLADSESAILLQLAQYYAAGQNYAKSISTLERYERIEGTSPEIAMRKFSLMYMQGDSARIMGESERLVKANPLSTEYLLVRGNVMEALALPDSALASYKRAEALDPDDGRVKLTLANYYLEQGDSAAYDLKSSEAILSDNIELDDKLDMMTRYMQNIISDTTADARRGARLFDGLLRQYPHEPKVLDLGAQYSATTGDNPRAIELMSYATDLEPENPDYWIRLAHFNFVDGRYEEAASICETAMEKLPEAPRGLLLVYSSSCSMADQYGKAREAYQKLLDLELPGALLTDDAQTMIRKAGKLPYEALMRVANIFEMVGDGSFKTGDLERSTQEYDVVLALNPDNATAINNYAYYLAVGDGDLEKAEKLSRKAVEQQPENPTYLDTLAWILYLKGHFAGALEIQEKAMENLTPEAEGTWEYWDHMGDIQYMNGRKDNAVESWKKALELDKGNKDIEEKIKYKRLNTKN